MEAAARGGAWRRRHGFGSYGRKWKGQREVALAAAAGGDELGVGAHATASFIDLAVAGDLPPKSAAMLPVPEPPIRADRLVFSLKVPDPFCREPNPSVASQRDVEEEKGRRGVPHSCCWGALLLGGDGGVDATRARSMRAQQQRQLRARPPPQREPLPAAPSSAAPPLPCLRRRAPLPPLSSAITRRYLSVAREERGERVEEREMGREEEEEGG
uniref:Uncharacterized protein n=1 Tax=Oryza sativa subsp. japonica TaxID=39947 RepID=Q6Z376_ORYSJ|nr:hypothetical protein [Oryza sativa Japonica Group]BAD31241.1 hypothetical protein [Oryza sativa Japonica Group]